MNDSQNFYTSDTHFSHARIIELCNRPWATTAEMDEGLIERWNSVVRPHDYVYHLGDVALGKIAESLPLIDRLNGTKFLVPGNHDRVSSAYEDKRPAFRERFMHAYGEVFEEILPEVHRHYVGRQPVLLSHYPYYGDSQDNDRHIEQRPKDEGLPLIHGHIHNTNRVGFVKDNMYHVGVDVHNFYPVSENEIVAWLKSLDNSRADQ